MPVSLVQQGMLQLSRRSMGKESVFDLPDAGYSKTLVPAKRKLRRNGSIDQEKTSRQENCQGRQGNCRTGSSIAQQIVIRCCCETRLL